MTINQIFTLFIVGTIPILFAAVQPWVWSFYSLCMMTVFLIFVWQDRSRHALVPGIGVNLMVVLFFAATMFLCLPLPDYILFYLISAQSGFKR